MWLPLIVLQVLTFAILIIVLKSLFQKHLDIALKRLKTSHQESLAREAQLKEELAKTKEQQRIQLEQAETRVKEMISLAEKEGQNLSKKIEDEASQKAENIIQKGKDTIEKLKQDVVTSADSESIGLSIKMIEHIFSAKGKEALHIQFIEEIISELDALDESKFTVKSDKVKVKTSLALNEKEKSDIKSVLSKKLNAEVVLVEEINDELIVGILLEIGPLIIDGSLRNRLNKIIPYLKKNQ